MPADIALSTTFLVGLLLWISIYDGATGLIPDIANAMLAGAGLIVTVWINPLNLWVHVLSACAGFSALWLIGRSFEALRGYRGLGGGDVKLFGAAGCWLGLAGLPTVLLIASLSALLTACIQGLLGNAFSRLKRIPFGPHLSVGLLTTWLLGPLQFA